MTDFVRPTEISFDQQELIHAALVAMRNFGWSGNNQLALTCREVHKTKDPAQLVHGEATLQNRENNEIIRQDDWYQTLIPAFEGTYFEHVLETFKSTKDRIGRLRLMKMPPKRGLSFHRDFGPRYHVAVLTNVACFFMLHESDEPYGVPKMGTKMPNMGTHHIPADGNAYWVNTSTHHTVYNGGKTDRIHLVCSIL